MSTQTKFTTEDRKLQADIMESLRKDGIIPTYSTIAKDTGVSYTTLHLFMNGNSRNKIIRSYLTNRIKKNLTPIPDNIQKLLDIWKGDSGE